MASLVAFAFLMMSRPTYAAPDQRNHESAESLGWPVLALSETVMRELASMLALYPAMSLDAARETANETGQVIVALVPEHGPPTDPDSFLLTTVFPDRHGPIETPEGHRFGTSIPFGEMTLVDFLENVVWLQLDEPARVEPDGRRVFRYEFEGIPAWSDISARDELGLMAKDPACYVGEARLHLLSESEVAKKPDRWRFQHYESHWTLEVETTTALNDGLPLVTVAHAVGPDCVPPSLPGGHTMEVVEDETFEQPGSGWPGRCLFRVEGTLGDGRPVAVELAFWKVGRRIPLGVPTFVSVCGSGRADSPAGYLYRSYPIEQGMVTLEDGTSASPRELVAGAGEGESR